MEKWKNGKNGKNKKNEKKISKMKKIKNEKIKIGLSIGYKILLKFITNTKVSDLT